MKLHDVTEKLHNATRVWRDFRVDHVGLQRSEGWERVQSVRIPNRTALKAIGDALRGYTRETDVEYEVGDVPTTFAELGERTDNQLQSIRICLTRSAEGSDSGRHTVATVEFFGKKQSGTQGSYFGRLTFYSDNAEVGHTSASLSLVKDAIDRETKQVGWFRRRRPFPVLINISGDESRSLRRDRRIRWQSAGISLGVSLIVLAIQWASAPGNL